MVAGRLSSLAGDYPDWQIQRVDVHPRWVAALRRDTFIHVIAAHDLNQLRKPEQVGGSNGISRMPLPAWPGGLGRESRNRRGRAGTSQGRRSLRC